MHTVLCRFISLKKKKDFDGVNEAEFKYLAASLVVIFMCFGRSCC